MSARIIVTTADPARAGDRQFAKALRQAGMTVDQVLTATGIISGSADPGRLPQLRAVPGVASVELEGDAQIPPPDSPIQ